MFSIVKPFAAPLCVLALTLFVLSETHADADILDGYLTHDKLSHTPHSTNSWRDLPWREGTELRISPEVDVRDVSTQTYSVRVRPIGKRERRTQASILSLNQRLSELESDRLQGEFVESRYHKIVSLAWHESKLALLHSELELMRAKLATNISSTQTERYVFNVQYLERQVELMEQSIVLERKHSVGAYFAINSQTRPTLYSSSKVIRAAQMLQIAGQIDRLLPTAAPQVLQSSLEVERAKAERRLDRTQTAFGLDLLELSYENKGIDSYNATFGWRLPSRRLSYANRKRVQAITAAESREHLVAEMIADQKTQFLHELETLVFNYNHLAQATVALHDRITSLRNNPESLLTFEEQRLRLAEDAAQTHTRLLTTYVEYLAISGAFTMLPQRNWLKPR